MYALVGELPLPVVNLLSSMRSSDGKNFELKESGPGFILPADIGDLGPGITILNLSDGNLKGKLNYADICWLAFCSNFDMRAFTSRC